MDSISTEEKNWNDLPDELKLECIEWMDFKTRLTFRQTSRTEKQLVEKSNNVPIETALSMDGHILEVRHQKQHIRFDWDFNRDVIEWIIKKAVIGHLRLRALGPMDREIRRIGMEFPIHVKELELYGATKIDVHILKKCRASRLKSLVVVFKLGATVTFSDFEEAHEVKIVNFTRKLNFQLLYTLESVRILRLDSIKPDEMIRWIQKWIETKKEPGCHVELEFSQEICQSEHKMFEEKKRKIFGHKWMIPMGNGKEIHDCSSASSYLIRI